MSSLTVPSTPLAWQRSTTALPTWPLLGLFWLFPLGWALGLGPVTSVVFGVAMLAHLALRGDVRVPSVMAPWLVFLLLVVLSGTMLDTFGRTIGFGFRVGNYLAATAALVYVVNTDRRVLTDDRLATALTALWVWVVLGGWLGLLVPDGSLTTPLGMVLPGWLASNELVSTWIHPAFASIQDPWGSPTTFFRPQAPFDFANPWGTNFALLLPFVLVTLRRLRGRRRLVLGTLLVLGVIPAAATLNRGMFLAIGVGLAYTALRSALRGRLLPAALMVGGGIVAAGVLVASGVVERILLRTEYSSTTDDRLEVYAETFRRTLDSPILGWGGPRPSFELPISVGTQGHLWNVMFSHGFVALACFLGALALFAWQTRHATGVARAAHVTLVMTMVTLVYYGYDGPQLVVVLTAAGIGLRQAVHTGGGRRRVAAPPRRRLEVAR